MVISTRDDTIEPAIEIVLHEAPRNIERTAEDDGLWMWSSKWETRGYLSGNRREVLFMSLLVERKWGLCKKYLL